MVDTVPRRILGMDVKLLLKEESVTGKVSFPVLYEGQRGEVDPGAVFAVLIDAARMAVSRLGEHKPECTTPMRSNVTHGRVRLDTMYFVSAVVTDVRAVQVTAEIFNDEGVVTKCYFLYQK